MEKYIWKSHISFSCKQVIDPELTVPQAAAYSHLQYDCFSRDSFVILVFKMTILLAIFTVKCNKCLSKSLEEFRGVSSVGRLDKTPS